MGDISYWATKGMTAYFITLQTCLNDVSNTYIYIDIYPQSKNILRWLADAAGCNGPADDLLCRSVSLLR